MNAAIFYIRHCECFEYSRCDWLNHTTWSHGNCRTHRTKTPKLVNTQPVPRSMEFETILLHYYTIQTSICCIDCLVIANICTYISLYIRNTAISLNKKFVCISLHQLVNTCDLHLAFYIDIPRGFKQEISPVEDLVNTTTSKHQRFTLNIVSSCENTPKLRCCFPVDQIINLI